MAVTITKPEINLREKLKELDFETVPFQKMPSGSVLQVVQDTHSTEITTSSTSQISLGLSATINLSTSSNKVLAIVYHPTRKDTTTSNTGFESVLIRNSTTILSTGYYWSYFLGDEINSFINYHVLDFPGVSGDVTYAVEGKVHPNGGTFRINDANSLSSLILMEIAG